MIASLFLFCLVACAQNASVDIAKAKERVLMQTIFPFPPEVIKDTIEEMGKMTVGLMNGIDPAALTAGKPHAAQELAVLTTGKTRLENLLKLFVKDISKDPLTGVVPTLDGMKTSLFKMMGDVIAAFFDIKVKLAIPLLNEPGLLANDSLMVAIAKKFDTFFTMYIKFFKEDLKAIAEGLDLKTAANEAWYWTGIREEWAAAFVRTKIKTAGITLEDKCRQLAAAIPLWKDTDEINEFFKIISANFAKGASGVVNLLYGNNVRAKAIFLTTEWDRLIANLGVSQIVAHDFMTGLQTVIFDRKLGIEMPMDDLKKLLDATH